MGLSFSIHLNTEYSCFSTRPFSTFTMINFTERYNSSIYRENHATVTADSEREVLRERLQISESTVKYKDEEIARYKNEVRHLHWP